MVDPRKLNPGPVKKAKTVDTPAINPDYATWLAKNNPAETDPDTVPEGQILVDVHEWMALKRGECLKCNEIREQKRKSQQKWREKRKKRGLK